MFTLSPNHFLAPAPAVTARAETRHVLAKRELLVLRRPLAQRVCCRSGRVWLTVDGWQADIVLEAGESFACDTDRRVVVQALRDASVEVR